MGVKIPTRHTGNTVAVLLQLRLGMHTRESMKTELSDKVIAKIKQFIFCLTAILTGHATYQTYNYKMLTLVKATVHSGFSTNL